MRKALLRLVRMAALVYAGLFLVLAGCQRNMMYFPTRCTEDEAVALAAMDGLVPWRNGEGELIGWRRHDAPESGDALLVFHGNAGFAAHRGYFAHGFAPHLAVHLVEYPGYGSRPGKPSEGNFAKAATAAFQQLRRERKGRIFVAGESLGTGVACGLAGKNPEAIAGLFLVTPFTRMVDVARSHYPVLPVGLFLRDRYENAAHLQNFRGPVAFLVAGRDEVIPARLGLALHEGYAGPKRLWLQAERSHNTLDYAPRSDWWREVAEFLGGGERGAGSVE
jgi:uncharacterized protein